MKKQVSITNRGTGAGGGKTNSNGLPYEIMTNLETEYVKQDDGTICFQESFKKLLPLHKNKLFKKLPPCSGVRQAHGCKQPDECYFCEKEKQLFIIEKKFQQCSGSVCEKIQTAPFKQWQYQRLYPDYRVVYMYCLSEWFQKNCPAELEYLHENKVPIFFGNHPDYKKQIILFIINYH